MMHMYEPFTAIPLEVRHLPDRDAWVLRTVKRKRLANVNTKARAVPPVHLHGLAGDKLYEMEEVHMGFGLSDKTNLISLEFSDSTLVYCFVWLWK